VCSPCFDFGMRSAELKSKLNLATDCVMATICAGQP